MDEDNNVHGMGCNRYNQLQLNEKVVFLQGLRHLKQLKQNYQQCQAFRNMSILIDHDENAYYCGQMESSSTLSNNSGIVSDMNQNINSTRQIRQIGEIKVQSMLGYGHYIYAMDGDGSLYRWNYREDMNIKRHKVKGNTQ